MEKATVKAQLVANYKDSMCYVTYVFELLDEEDKKRLNTKYIMCVRYPNWECPEIQLFEVGYLFIIEVLAGVDKYFDGLNMKPYNYSNIQFIKFVREKPQIDKTITLD